ncbi:MAG: ribokinase [Cyanobacteria bacterium J007]|jgi:sugar/nucleoside kinase (ribokinase family)|nr:MAG: ribokinase [Cyanobacteria bacterium J007]
MFDICIIGHVTKDIIRIDGEITREIAGGTAIYSALALRSLGANVAVATKTAGDDRPFVNQELERWGITVFWQESEKTTIFENNYRRDNLDRRTQNVRAIADPFTVEDVAQIEAKIVHLGPLIQGDIPIDIISTIRDRNKFKTGQISLDAQGYLRRVDAAETVCPVDWKEKETGLQFVDILKVDRTEACLLSGCDRPEEAAKVLANLGVREVVITFGSGGSYIYTGDRGDRVPAFTPQEEVDPTGCGDTYIAGYLYQRLLGLQGREAGEFAARLATRKLEGFGPLKTGFDKK